MEVGFFIVKKNNFVTTEGGGLVEFKLTPYNLVGERFHGRIPKEETLGITSMLLIGFGIASVLDEGRSN